MNAPEIDDIIRKNRLLAQALEINGTPSFVMGEAFVRGYVALDQMRDIVAAEREDG
jgi:protein-disulfide isomerase